MTEYLKKSFSVAMPTGEAYRDNWEATFGKKEDPPTPCAHPLVNESSNVCVVCLTRLE